MWPFTNLFNKLRGKIVKTTEPILVKPKVVLIPGYGTNRRTFQGLIDYLNEFFEIYFIDLPGFAKEVPPLHEISFQSFGQYIQKELDELNLDSYVLAGVSLGFGVIGQLKLDDRCKAIMGLFPYTNIESINFPFYEKLYLVTGADIISRLKIYDKVFYSEFFHTKFLEMGIGQDSLKITLEDMDARTYFETMRLIFQTQDEYHFQHKPYILIYNPHDNVVNGEYLVKLFHKKTKDPLVIENSVSHLLPELSTTYFRQHLNRDRIVEIKNYLEILL